MPNREVLNFITSGRMSSLRELSIAIDYKDWVSGKQITSSSDSRINLIFIASLPTTVTHYSSPTLAQHPLHCRPCNFSIRS